MSPADASSQPAGLEDLLNRLLSRTEGQDTLCIDDLLSAFGQRGFGPMILVPAVLLTLPTGALPGVPIVLGLVISLVALELVFGRTRPALPHIFRKVKVSRPALQKGVNKAAPVLRFLDGLVTPRLSLFVRPPFLQLAALACVALTPLLIPLEFIPFATAIPGAAMIVIGLAITAEDGLALLAGLLAAAAAAAAAFFLGAQAGLF